MDYKNIDVEKVVELFKSGIDCGQVIVGAISEEIGADVETCVKIASGFGGGMFEADMCGAYIGGIMAVGLKYGHCKEGDDESKVNLIKKVFEFKEEYKKICDKKICKDILKYDLTNPKDSEIIAEKNLLFTVCPKLVVDVIEIVKNL